ncbi:hypothetical protein FB45DRAFT_953934 [Roridomyces roridus]|uniref:DUF6535 domain-containing protein n=1 Tax=Roridomyces roridus TaxID=1738132 RepID=A0AAD7AZ83_9AGAR|nr:hypothetical protein FB45DRAFT_953934 [Roridomyces roridus]
MTILDATSLNDNAPSEGQQSERDDLAASKLWDVYVSEAEKYDKSLVEGWKSDMDVLLIFAGLFSTSLTAFLVESYKTLTPDEGTITIQLLSRISDQLNQSSGTRPLDPLITASFHPPAAAFACNILWFLSLGLSLSCALIATLVEQWSRDFMQRTQIHPSPMIRARIFSYLYFGIQRFGMHALVGFVPVLLHISLLLFLGGLVAFLIPISTALTLIVGSLFACIIGTYGYLTLLPLLFSDSPYRTPFSNVVWSIFRGCSVLRNKSISPDPEKVVKSPAHDRSQTMVDVMVRDAMTDSPKCQERDGRAIVWTVRSLTHNNELEPLVNALPDLIYGPHGRRRVHDSLINRLLNGGDTQLVRRIEGLLRSCDSGLLAADLETRRRLSCVKALWALAYFLASDARAPSVFPAFDAAILRTPRNRGIPHAVAAYGLMRWLRFLSFLSRVREVRAMSDDEQPPPYKTSLERESNALMSFGIDYLEVGDLQRIQDSEYDPLLRYMETSAWLDEMPHEFEATCRIMRPSTSPLREAHVVKLRETLGNVLDRPASEYKALESSIHQVDIVVAIILEILQDDPGFCSSHVGKCLVKYAGPRPKGEGFRHALHRCRPKRLGFLLTNYLATGPGNLTQNTLYTIWTLAISQPPLASFNEDTLNAVRAAPVFPISPSVIAVLKSNIVAGVDRPRGEELAATLDRLQIPAPVPAQASSLTPLERWNHAPFSILLDFLEHDASLTDPRNKHRASDTFTFLVQRCRRYGMAISLQMRFAAWFMKIIQDAELYAQSPMVEIVIEWLYESKSCEPFE